MLVRNVLCSTHNRNGVDLEGGGGGGGGDSIMKSLGARGKIWIVPLKETILGVAQALFNPKKIPLKTE